MGSEFYDPVKKKWGQAHSQARFAILQTLLRAKIVEFPNSPGPDMTIKVHYDKIKTEGKKAVEHLLLTLHELKSTADVGGRRMIFL